MLPIRRADPVALAVVFVRARRRRVRTGRNLAAFSAALRPVLLVLWSLAFGFTLARSGKTWEDAFDVSVFLFVGALVALSERFYHRGRSGRIVGL